MLISFPPPRKQDSTSDAKRKHYSPRKQRKQFKNENHRSPEMQIKKAQSKDQAFSKIIFKKA
jgi:hypothetical protein